MSKSFMIGNEALGEAAVRAGCRFYSGYPITPQTEIGEYLAKRMPEVGGVFIQGESETASISMVYGAASTGVRAMTSSSSCGILLKLEGLSYIAMANVPCVIVNVSRGGPSVGYILPTQSDYLMSTKAPGNGGLKIIVLAPDSVQEAVDMVPRAFEYAERDRHPVMILMDGCIGMMMDHVELPEMRERVVEDFGWNITGSSESRERRLVHAIPIGAEVGLEALNIKMGEMHERWAKNDAQWEEYNCDDADVILVAYGISARVCKGAINVVRQSGIKAGLIRPITLNPFPSVPLEKLDPKKIKRIVCVEMAIPSQIIDDVRLAVKCRIDVDCFNRSGGVVVNADEVSEFLLRTANRKVVG